MTAALSAPSACFYIRVPALLPEFEKERGDSSGPHQVAGGGYLLGTRLPDMETCSSRFSCVYAYDGSIYNTEYYSCRADDIRTVKHECAGSGQNLVKPNKAQCVIDEAIRGERRTDETDGNINLSVAILIIATKGGILKIWGEILLLLLLY
jgi:hypothetical protein